MTRPGARALSRLGWGFATLVAATLALMVLGAVVRAKGAGLACPDWPLCFGQAVPAFNVQIALEWSHRVLAASVSAGLVGLGFLSLRTPERRALVARPLAVAGALLAAQVVLGGLTVLLSLAPWTVTAHLVTGSAFCVALLWISRSLFEAASPEPRAREPLGGAALGLLALAGASVVLQIALGGMVSSHGAGLACARFPTCDGAAFAPTLSGLVGLHVLHRLNGYAVFALFAALVLALRNQPRLGPLAWSCLHLVILQIGIGALNVVTRLPVEVTALHSGFAAALVLLTSLLVREALLGQRGRTPGLRAGALEVG